MVKKYDKIAKLFHVLAHREITFLKGEAAIYGARLLSVFRKVGAHLRLRAQQEDSVGFEPTTSQHLRVSRCRLYH